MLSLDTECTGPDFWHGCKPFYVSTCTPTGTVRSWHWWVDPETRIPVISPKEVADLRAYLDTTDTVVFHNAKFDIRALSTIGVKPAYFWNKCIHDTHIASHVLWSGESHALKDLALLHLDIPDTDDVAVTLAATKARTIAKSLGWDTARHGHPHFPGLPKTTKWAKMDSWLPRQIAEVRKYPAKDPWRTVLQEYGNRDAERTVLLWELFRKLMEDQVHDGISSWDIYLKRRDMLRPVYEMESHGLHMLPDAYESELDRYTGYNQSSQRTCRILSGNPELNLNSHPQVSKFLFQDCKLPATKKTKTGYSVDADVVGELLETVRPQSKPGRFIHHLHRYRKTDKCLDFLGSYLKYSIKDILHPNLNIPGTGTTRLASHNPNGQNVSRQEKYNLRRVFGPSLGRMWLSVDYSNIELRMLAYASQEKELIAAFERGESVHMNFAWVICPWAILKVSKDHTDSWLQEQRLMLPPKDRKILEKAFKETEQYHWVKNGDFALTYGATENTADTTYHILGAYQQIRGYFTNLAGFMKERISEAYRTHEVYTLGGYRLQIPHGREYTTAVDYYCQGSAGWVMCLGINNCHQFLQTTNTRYPGYNGHMILTIHDELLFDLPAKHRANTEVIRMLQQCMEMPGTELGVPTPTEAKLIYTNWAEGSVYDGTSLLSV